MIARFTVVENGSVLSGFRLYYFNCQRNGLMVPNRSAVEAACLNNDPQMKKWFCDNRDFRLFFLCGAAGIAGSFATFRLLDGYALNAGKNLLGLFFPPLLCVLYCAYTGYRHAFSKILAAKTATLYLVQILPFVPLFWQVFVPTPEDDFTRYYLYARNMVEHHTLWGGDKLFFPATGLSYATQPGYRYFIAAELLAFRHLYRFVQFFNIGILVMALFCFLKTAKAVGAKKGLTALAFTVVVLFTLFAVKNLLMGLAEWLTVVLLVAGVYLYAYKRRLPAALFFLGLVPFFRQNLLIAIVLLAVWMIVHSRKKTAAIAAFVIPLLLPLVHNLYYAGEWRFFVKLFATPFVNETQPTGFDFGVAAWNLLRLIGFERVNGQLRFDLLAFAFLPLSLVVYGWMAASLKPLKRQAIYIVITLAAIMPALLLGKDYYPRFEFVSVAMILVVYYALTANLSVQEA